MPQGQEKGNSTDHDEREKLEDENLMDQEMKESRMSEMMENYVCKVIRLAETPKRVEEWDEGWDVLNGYDIKLCMKMYIMLFQVFYRNICEDKVM